MDDASACGSGGSKLGTRAGALATRALRRGGMAARYSGGEGQARRAVAWLMSWRVRWM
jgi:hypothetical protein